MTKTDIIIARLKRVPYEKMIALYMLAPQGWTNYIFLSNGWTLDEFSKEFTRRRQ